MSRDNRPTQHSLTMLSDHSKKRDKYGLPIVKPGKWIGFADEDYSEEDRQKKHMWNVAHQQLVCLTGKTRNHIEEVVFLQTWLMPHLHLHDYPSTRSLSEAVIDFSNDKLIQEEIDLLNRTAKAAERLAHASAVILEHVVSDIPDRFSPRSVSEGFCCPPQGQLRLWGSQSHTKYDKQLGFLSSSWTTCRPAADLKELKQRGVLSVTSLQSHCENQSSPSDWISLSGEVSWMLKYIDRKWPPGSVSVDSMRIALVSTAKMERLNLLFDRSDFLVQGAGGRPYSATSPNGVKFAWHSHYLVYGWIPAQCVVKIFTLEQFRDICKNRNIRPGQYLLGALTQPLLN